MLCNDARLYALAGPGEITSLSEKVYESYTGAFIAFGPEVPPKIKQAVVRWVERDQF
jgi:hypothetical protein